MRTTIEISNKHRSILLSLAAQKGLRGYSLIIQEALDYYIVHQTKALEKKMDILKMKGSWKAEKTKESRSKLTELRENWKQL
ncbi:MAG: hypothetical protein LWW97_03010 [Deltaproteobacteria bacterium]|nr:hypothetical protein [Deltaproteobacteria bacterium]